MKMGMITFIAIVIASASASARTTLTGELFNTLEDKKLIDKIRVYSSNKVTVTYEKSISQQEKVEAGDYNTSLSKNVLEIVVPTKIKGKILGIKQNFMGQSLGLYVTFDNKCSSLTNGCAFVYSFHNNHNNFILTSVPHIQNYEATYLQEGLMGIDSELEINMSDFVNITKSKEVLQGVD